MSVVSRLTGDDSDALPNELICEIFHASDWKDVLHVRQTCRKLCGITKIRSIWTHLVECHWKYGSPERVYLERPITSYNSQELESLFLQWKAAEAGWSRSCLSNVRTFHLERRRSDHLHLVKGGRWLLLATDLGRVTYYDLDADDIVGTILIMDQYTRSDRHEHTEMKMVIDMEAEPQDGLFKFDIVFSFVCKPPGVGIAHATGLHEIRIWRVNLLTMGDSDVACGLKTDSNPLGRLPHPPLVESVRGLSLLGNTLAFMFLCLSANDIGIYSVVLDWKKSCRRLSQAQTPLWKVVDKVGVADNRYEVQEIHLLPHDRLLSRFGRKIKLHDYTDFRPTSIFNMNAAERPTSCEWKISGDSNDIDDAPASQTNCYFSAQKETSTVLFFGSLDIYAVRVLNRPTAKLPSCMSSPFTSVKMVDISHIHAISTTPEDHSTQVLCIDLAKGARILVPSRLLSQRSVDNSRPVTKYVDYGSARVLLVPVLRGGLDELINIEVTVHDLSLRRKPQHSGVSVSGPLDAIVEDTSGDQIATHE